MIRITGQGEVQGVQGRCRDHPNRHCALHLVRWVFNWPGHGFNGPGEVYFNPERASKWCTQVGAAALVYAFPARGALHSHSTFVKECSVEGLPLRARDERPHMVFDASNAVLYVLTSVLLRGISSRCMWSKILLWYPPASTN